MRVLPLLLAALALAGCGDDGGDEREAPARQSATELTVTVDGGKPKTVTDAGGLTPADFAPVPGTQACTQIYGGDATATVTGTLDGERVDAEFSLANGCEIARWERAAPVLGDPPTGSGP